MNKPFSGQKGFSTGRVSNPRDADRQEVEEEEEVPQKEQTCGGVHSSQVNKLCSSLSWHVPSTIQIFNYLQLESANRFAVFYDRKQATTNQLHIVKTL